MLIVRVVNTMAFFHCLPLGVWCYRPELGQRIIPKRRPTKMCSRVDAFLSAGKVGVVAISLCLQSWCGLYSCIYYNAVQMVVVFIIGTPIVSHWCLHRHNVKWVTDSKCLGYYCNLRSLMKGTREHIFPAATRWNCWDTVSAPQPKHASNLLLNPHVGGVASKFHSPILSGLFCGIRSVWGSQALPLVSQHRDNVLFRPSGNGGYKSNQDVFVCQHSCFSFHCFCLPPLLMSCQSLLIIFNFEIGTNHLYTGIVIWGREGKTSLSIDF